MTAKRMAMLIAVTMALAARPAHALPIVVDDDGHPCSNAQFSTISAAVAAARDGGEIHVCPGTYDEQVVIDKNLRIVGLGDPVIRPTSLPESRPSLISGRPVTAGILIDGGRTVLKGLVLDLDQNGSVRCTPVMTGIYFRNAGGVVESSQVRHTATRQENPLAGNLFEYLGNGRVRRF